MANDTMLLKAAAKLVGRGTSGQRAIWEAGASVSEMLHNLGGYMAERATDVLDVRARIVAELRGVAAPGIPASEHAVHPRGRGPRPGRHRNPGPEKVLALVTAGGGPQSHTAIIARSLGLPAVVAAAGVDELADGTEVYVDGAAGTIIAEPEDAERAAAAQWAATASLLAEFDGNGRDGGRPPRPAPRQRRRGQGRSGRRKPQRPGRRPVPDRVLLPGTGLRTHRGGTIRRLQGRF